MPLSGVDLNLLVALDALLTQRNVTRAAEQVSVGQPAMSAALARLRKQFNDPLLDRVGQGYALTSLAESLVIPVREAIAAAEVVLGAQKPFDPAHDEHSFCIVASDYVAVVLLQPLIADLATEAPKVRIGVAALEGNDDDLVRRGQADMLIYPTELASGFEDLPRSILFEDRYVLVSDRANREVDGLDLERFLALPFLSFSGNTPSSVHNQTTFQGHTVEARFTVHSHVTVPLMLRGTSMVALVQERLALRLADEGNLQLQSPPVELHPIIEAMYWSPRTSHDSAHRWLRERLLQQSRKMRDPSR